MKFYDCATAPSPRRVRIFLAEKGISVPTVQVDLRNNEQLTPAFRAIIRHPTKDVLTPPDPKTVAAGRVSTTGSWRHTPTESR